MRRTIVERRRAHGAPDGQTGTAARASDAREYLLRPPCCTPGTTRVE